MFASFDSKKLLNKTVGVAVSGGSDSMALLHFLNSNANSLRCNVVAINVEHGIRGQSSIDDTNFVQSYCEKNGIPLFCYSVDCQEKAQMDKISLESAGRVLRYQCFFDAINTKKCDLVATAHHQKDNVESILMSLFRGTGLKGLAGITEYSDKIIRPFLYTAKSDIENYIKENDVPFVTDQTNFCDVYTRNGVRLNIIPQIEKIFPEALNSISRLSKIAQKENDFLDRLCDEIITTTFTKDGTIDYVKIKIDSDEVLIKRAIIKAVKYLGIEKDWEFSHAESVYSLTKKSNGAKTYLPKNVVAIREYDGIVIYIDEKVEKLNLPLCESKFTFNKKQYIIEYVESENVDLKSGLYVDKDKCPNDVVIRTKLDCDVFTKFGGGTKSLSNYLTDKKIPLRLRDKMVVLASKNDILVVFGVAISEKVKADGNTKTLIKFIQED